MDNRNDASEDQQSTPEHPAGPAGLATGQAVSGPSGETGSGLSAGPHNEAPQSSGIEDTYERPQTAERSGGHSDEQSSQRAGGDSMSARMKVFTQTITGNPLPWFIGAAGLLLLALQRARRR